MDCTDIIQDFWCDDWQKIPTGYAKFIGSIGTCPSVPTRPTEWTETLQQEIKKHSYIAEEGLDFWLFPVNGKVGSKIVYGAEIRLSTELYQQLHFVQRTRHQIPFNLGVLGIEDSIGDLLHFINNN